MPFPVSSESIIRLGRINPIDYADFAHKKLD